MAQSQNSTVDFTAKAPPFQGLATYGVILIANKALEFTNQNILEDNIQFPWDKKVKLAA